MMVFSIFVVFLFSYLLGSIPFGLLLARVAGLGDIRSIGSGNIGATNVLRTGNKKIAALTLLLDGVKGAVAVLIVGALMPDLAAVAGLGALLGHLFPVWLKFKGGKGVATGIGVVTALAWPVGLAMIGTWLVVAKLFRISSLAALVAVGFVPLDVWVFGRGDSVPPPLSLIIVALIFFKHRENIRRLLTHTEPRIGASENGASPSERR